MNDTKHILDVGAALTALGSIMHWMPEVAALLSVIWYGIRLYEWYKGKK